MNTVASPLQDFGISFQDQFQVETRFVEAIIYDARGNKLETMELFHVETGFYQRTHSILKAGVYTGIVTVYTNESRDTILDSDFQYFSIRSDSVAGVGSVAFVYTVQDEALDPVPDAKVIVSTDELQQNVVAGPQFTNLSGQVVFNLDPGDYFFWTTKSGFNPDNPDEETVKA